MSRLVERGPFRLLRDVPQIGFVVLAAILCGDLAVLGQRTSENRASTAKAIASSASSDSPATPTTGEQVTHSIFGSPATGPLPGQVPNVYVSLRKAELALRAKDEATRQAVAVVSFRSTETPSETFADLPGVAVTGLFVRVQLRGRMTPAGLVAVSGGSVEDLELAVAGLVPGLAEDEAANISQGNTVSNLDIPVNAAQKQAFLQEAATEKAELAVLNGPGRAVYGAVVTGTYAELAAVAKGRQVRLVDPADDGVSAKSVVPHALAPDDTGTVAAPETLPGLGAP